MSYKIVSWNVNGIRAIVKKGFLESVAEMSPDILCLQETKAQFEDAKTALSLLSGYHTSINYSKARKGYSGTAILSKEEPISVTQDMGLEEHDQEGRVVTAEFEKFFLVDVYTPNSGSGLKRLDYRETWDVAFLDHMKKLEAKKPLIVCGDLNVAHQAIDIARSKENYNKSAGYTQREIDGFEKYLAEGWVDSFRHLHPEEVKYSYWNQMFNARARNVGWRIDYFLVSKQLIDKVKEADIYNQYMGSDHCPVAIDLDV
ncbi:exodeoxyribonuclease III [Fulvivirga sp. M361]|uniref:exodeoxyribonuclease III n=1 Tax=Fulvivirga sp. M361 TaxID=2594266 RepID=UPI00117B7709|nr:exodeoxyribonuclease III [Fulvivirga sp. M361]TRX59399.1 exodeoxyribonuclease III [Fulvivirga sp. M361]